MNIVVGTERIEDEVKAIEQAVRSDQRMSKKRREEIQSKLESIKDEILPPYYVFKCPNCERRHAAQMDCLDLILAIHCKCQDMYDLSHAPMLFIGIEKRSPGHCVTHHKF